MRSKSLIILLSIVLLAGCASIATQRMAGNLSLAMLNQSDPEIVRAGAPAYLLLIDSLIADEPNNPELLLSGARLYGAYAGGLVQESVRRRGLTAQALGYARRALCEENRKLCEVLDLPYRDFAPALERVNAGDLPILYGHATAWLGWIEARSDDWNAVAALPKVEAMLQRIVELQPDFERGRAQLYLGALLSLRPADEQVGAASSAWPWIEELPAWAYGASPVLSGLNGATRSDQGESHYGLHFLWLRSP